MSRSTTPEPVKDFGSDETYSFRKSSVASEHMAQRTAAKQADFLLPHLRPGMWLLDCGCGPGTITIGLAELVTPGQVVGIDNDESQIELAQKNASKRKVSNVHFQTDDIYELAFPDASFDAVYSNAVLDHLGEPLKALTEIRRVLRPGGVVGIRDVDWSGILIAPFEPLIKQTFEIFQKLIEHNGGNPHIGKTLRALLRKTGFARIQASATYECYATIEATQAWGSMMAVLIREETHTTQLTELGLVDCNTLDRMCAAWERWSEDPDAFFADCWCEVVGWLE